MGEVEVGEDARSFVGVKVGGETQNNNIPKAELKRDRQSLINDEAESNQSPTKKQAKEFSNDDVCSEVTNPIISPKANPSTFQDITSQPSELANGGSQAECGEVTSAASSRNSSLEETLSNEEPSAIEASQIDNDRSNGVLKSRIVLEIPELAASAGVRKITFKFSKRKEEYDTHSVTSGFDSISSYGGSCQVPGPYSSAMFDANVEIPEYCYQKGSGKTRKSLVCDPYMELKKSKKVVQANYPTNVKKLLATGILDGARVIYVSSSSEKQMNGIISGGGYLCGCSACNFTRVLSAYEFEHHAGFKTRHPNNHIYLENGRPIYSIIQELKTAPLSMLNEVFRDLAGSSVNEEHFQIWKASLQQNNEIAEVGNRHRPSVLRLPHLLVGCSSPSLEESISSASYSFAQNNFKREIYMETTEEQKRIMNKSNSYTSYSIVQHKKTAEGCTRRRDNDLHRLLFMPNGLPDGAELAYYVKGQRILGGRKQGNGIACNCCNREVSPSQFEAHAGMAARRQPYRHIYTTSGLTLHDIAISLANGQNFITGDSDDMCAVCGDGGDLILCHGCPRAFHAACLDLPWVPQHDWHCPNCKDGYGSGRKTATGESSNISRPIVIRLTRVVKAPEIEIGGCVVCRGHDFSSAKFDERTVMLCDQCEKEFHVGCLRESGLCDLKELPKDKWFCSDDCSRIHVALQNSVSVGVEIVSASSSCMILRKLVDKGLPLDGIAEDIQWRVLSGKSRYPEHLPYLSRSAAIFRECFDPIVAPSGRDLIPVMVYGRNISGQEFGGMYCIVLIVRSIVVSAGLLRVFGREVAELPLVATSREHQGKGYFQALFLCVERLLSSLNVENIVLPAAEEAESIWTNKFGFTKMSEERLSKYTREVQFTIFKGTSMLEKTLPRMVE